MTTRISIKAAAILAAVLCAVSARAQSPLQRCDGPISDVESLSRSASTCRSWIDGAPRGADLKNPAKAAGAEVWISTIIVNAEMGNAISDDKGLAEKLAVYFGYLAFVESDLSRCASMLRVNLGEATCRELHDELNFVRALRGPSDQFVPGCMKRKDMAPHDLSGARLQAWCSALAENKDNPAALCAKLLPMSTPKDPLPGAAECAANFSALRGDEGACASLPAERKSTCRGDALFAKANRARSVSACGGDRRCRVLMGEGRQVLKEMEGELTSAPAQYVLKAGWNVKIKQAPPTTPAGTPTTKAPEGFKGFACVDPPWTESNRKVAAATVKAAQTCLIDVESVLSASSPFTKDVDSKMERLARLQLQIDAALTAPEPTKTKPH